MSFADATDILEIFVESARDYHTWCDGQEEQLRANRRVKRAASDSTRSARGARWRSANRERQRELQRQWRERNKAKAAAASRAWRDAHPGRDAELKRARRAAKKAAA